MFSRMYYYFLYLRTYLIIKRKQLLDAVSLARKNSYTPFVILSEPRSGSTLLHTYLNSHTQIKSYGEVLRENLEERPDRTIKDPLSKLAFKPHTPALKAIGLKLFYEYYEHPLYAESFKNVIDRKDIKIIHLIRRDPLKVYTSLKIAQKTNVWSTLKSADANRIQKIQIDCEDYTSFLKSYLKHQQLFSAMFTDHPLLEIAYEDLAKNPGQTLYTVQEFLGVKPKKLFSLLKKQNPDSLQSLVVNYGEAVTLTHELYLSKL